MTQAGADNNRACCTYAARLIDQTWNRLGGRGDNYEFRDKGQFAEVADSFDAVDLGIVLIHQSEFAFEVSRRYC